MLINVNLKMSTLKTEVQQCCATNADAKSDISRLATKNTYRSMALYRYWANTTGL